MSRERTRPPREGVDLEVGQRVRQARSERSITQTRLAADVGCRPMTISDIENGLSHPAADLIKSIARALNVSIDWILTGEGRGPVEAVPADEVA